MSRNLRSGFAWLELLLVLAVIALILQLWPELGHIFLLAIDFRNWPRTVWFTANFVIVLLLLSIRIGPDMVDDWRERRKAAAANRARAAKALQKKNEREAMEQMQESRNRRIY